MNPSIRIACGRLFLWGVTAFNYIQIHWQLFPNAPHYLLKFLTGALVPLAYQTKITNAWYDRRQNYLGRRRLNDQIISSKLHRLIKLRSSPAYTLYFVWQRVCCFCCLFFLFVYCNIFYCIWKRRHGQVVEDTDILQNVAGIHRPAGLLKTLSVLQ